MPAFRGRLDCERNTKSMERRVRAAARLAGLVTSRTARTFFEHGQWWVEHATTGAQWSVCDSEGAAGVHTFNGFSFERVTEGEES